MPLRGDRLRESRDKIGLTQRQFAKLIDVTEYQISRYETGKSEATTTKLEAMARHLGVSADYLLGLTDSPQGHYDDQLSEERQKVLEAYESGDSLTLLGMFHKRLEMLARYADRSEP